MEISMWDDHHVCVFVLSVFYAIFQFRVQWAIFQKKIYDKIWFVCWCELKLNFPNNVLFYPLSSTKLSVLLDMKHHLADEFLIMYYMTAIF
jgi:hypothetical protein